MQMGEKNRENSLSEIFNDYEKTPVPPKARQTWFEQGMVWLGSGFGLSGLATGGLLANGLSFKEMLLVSVLGSLIITLLGMLNAIVSTHLHLSTSFTARRPFGRQGAKIIGIILCFSNFGWYAFQADLFGNTVSSIIREVRGTAINPVIFTIIGGITAFGRIFDAFTDPMIASWSDRCTSKNGRRIPFLKWASLPLALSTVLVFWSPVNKNSWINAAFLLVMILAYYLSLPIVLRIMH